MIEMQHDEALLHGKDLRKRGGRISLNGLGHCPALPAETRRFRIQQQ